MTPGDVESDRSQRARGVTPVGDVVRLGVIQFHEQPDLRARFFEVRDDLTAAGCIVDLWLMDIATVLGEFGYEVTVRRVRE